MRFVRSALCAAAAVVLAAPTAAAQTSFSIAAGATLPMGSTADAVEAGYNAIAGVGIKPPLAPLGVRFEGMFTSMENKALPSTSTRILSGSANLTLSGAGMAVPMGYLIGGLGMYRASCSGCGAGATSETDFGFNIGVGLNIPLTGFGTFAEARLHVILSDPENVKIVPITFGMKF